MVFVFFLVLSFGLLRVQDETICFPYGVSAPSLLQNGFWWLISGSLQNRKNIFFFFFFFFCFCFSPKSWTRQKNNKYVSNSDLGGGNSKIFDFHPDPWGFMIQFDEHIFQLGWFNHQLAIYGMPQMVGFRIREIPENFTKKINRLVKYYEHIWPDLSTR